MANAFDDLSDYEFDLILFKPLLALFFERFAEECAANELHDEVDTLLTHVAILQLAVRATSQLAKHLVFIFDTRDRLFVNIKLRDGFDGEECSIIGWMLGEKHFITIVLDLAEPMT